MIEVDVVVHLRKNKRVKGWKVTDRVPIAVCTANIRNVRRQGWAKLDRDRLNDRLVLFHSFDRSRYCERFGYINTWAAPRNVVT